MSKVAKKLVSIRKQRREIKEEWAYVNWIWLRMKDKIVERPCGIYKYRTNIMKEIKED